MLNWINFDEIAGGDEIEDIHPFLKGNFSCYIVGGTSSGKTNICFNLLLNDDFKVEYDKIYIFSPDALNENKYQWLVKYFQDKENAYYKATKKKIELIHVSTNLDDIPPLDSLDKKIRTVFLIDDYAGASVKSPGMITLKDYFKRARKHAVKMFFLSQSFYSLPKFHRQQMRHMILMKLDDSRELNPIRSEIGSGINPKLFLKAYHIATKQPHGFLFYSKKGKTPKERFHNGLDGEFDFLDEPSDSEEDT